MGALGALVEYDRTGLKSPAGDETARAESLTRIVTAGTLANDLGCNARAEYLARYTPARNFEMLNAIYAGVLASESYPARRLATQGHSALWGGTPVPRPTPSS